MAHYDSKYADSKKKRKALREAMFFTKEQDDVYAKLCKVINECYEHGISFAFDGDHVHVFRSDVLKDITTNMVPMQGQEVIHENSFYMCIYKAWDIQDGLYANLK